MAVNDDMGMEFAAISEADVGLDDAVGADLDVLAKLGLWGDDGGGVNHALLEDAILSAGKKRACFDGGFCELPLAVKIETKAGKVAVRPLVGSDHGQGVFASNGIEVVGLADDGFEVDVGFVDELVPVEVLDGGDVFLAHLDKLLLEVAFDLADAA